MAAFTGTKFVSLPMQFLLLLLSFALVHGKPRKKDRQKEAKDNHGPAKKVMKTRVKLNQTLGASPKRILSATAIAQQQIKNAKPTVAIGKSLEAGGNAPNASTNEIVSNYRCDFNTDTRESTLGKMYLINDSKKKNKEERNSCIIILNSCFPITSESQNSSTTSSYEEQRARLVEIRKELTLQRLQTRLLVVSALRCDWTLNNRLCIPKDTAETAAEKLVYFQKIFDLAVEGSDGYRLIQRQKDICDKKSKNEVLDIPEFLEEEDAESADTAVNEEEQPENEDTQDDQGAAVDDSTENDQQELGNEGTEDDQGSADDSDPEAFDETRAQFN